MPERRAAQWDAARGQVFDAVIVGAGINGAATYAELARRGYRVALVDRGDFAAGTSQASAMMVWGGLLYLTTLDLPAVLGFSASRDALIARRPDWVRLAPNRYVPARGDTRSPAYVSLALWVYWVLGAFRRRAPARQRDFPERGMFRTDRLLDTFLYEEARVSPSDARFVAHWILPWIAPERPALNYCEVAGGGADGEGWRLEVRDRVTGREESLRARWVVNAAGVWTDRLNERFGIASAWKHVFSKGVFIGLPREEAHATTLTFENRQADAYSLIPWGPVALWGPTETVSPDPDSGFAPEPEDVRTLLAELNRHLARPAKVSDITTLRCGVRPLAVKQSYVSDQYTLNISRRHAVTRDRGKRWLSLYGGKLSGCEALGAEVAAALAADRAAPPRAALPPRMEVPSPATDRFPGLADPVPSAREAVSREWCWTLDDYLRRRTNVAQWVPRQGLGRSGEHREALAALAGAFPGVDGVRGEAALTAYCARVEREYDRVLAAV